MRFSQKLLNSGKQLRQKETNGTQHFDVSVITNFKHGHNTQYEILDRAHQQLYFINHYTDHGCLKCHLCYELNIVWIAFKM